MGKGDSFQYARLEGGNELMEIRQKKPPDIEKFLHPSSCLG
jgi:hypothetical protein